MEAGKILHILKSVFQNLVRTCTWLTNREKCSFYFCVRLAAAVDTPLTCPPHLPGALATADENVVWQ